VLNDALCVPLGLPLVPIASVPWFQARPVSTAVAVLLVLGVVMFLSPLRSSRAAWGVAAGTVLATAPTLLVFSAGYCFYLQVAGWATLLGLWGQKCWRSRPWLVTTMLGGLASVYLVHAWSGSWTMHTAAMVERTVLEDILATGPAHYPPGTRVYFMNQPVVAAEIGPALRLAAQRPDLQIYPLTFSQELFLPLKQIEITQEDNRTLLARASGEGFFAGVFGEAQLGWFGACRRDLVQGPVTPAAAAGPLPFRVEVVAATDRGISALRFIFDRPLDDPTNRIFVVTPTSGAQLLQAGPNGSASAGPVHDAEFDRRIQRLRRMQLGYDRALGLLLNCP
jgi:hypothetical protein